MVRPLRNLAVVLRGFRSPHRDALWPAALGALVLALVMATQDFAWATDRYVPRLASQSLAGLPVIASFCGAFGAREATLLRESWRRLPQARHGGVVVASRLLPPVAAAVAVQSVVALVVLRQQVLQVAAWLPFASMGVAAVIVWVLVGMALGLVLPRLVAVPLSALVAFSMLSVPFSWAVMWPRHMTGVLVDCCSLGTTVHPAAVMASLAGAVGLGSAAGAVLLIRLGMAPVRWGVAAALTLLAVGWGAIGWSQARTVGVLPVRARSTSEQVCQATVCIWPEALADASANAEAWSQVNTAWHSLGLADLREKVSSAPRPDSYDLVVLSTDPRVVTNSQVARLPTAAARCDLEVLTDDERDAAEKLSSMLLAVLASTDPTPTDLQDEARHAWSVLDSCQR